MSDETTNEVTTLETLQNSLVVVTSETMKSKLTEIVEKLEKLETESELSSNSLRHAYKELMKELENVDNLIAALESIHMLIFRKGGIPVSATMIPTGRQ